MKRSGMSTLAGILMGLGCLLVAYLIEGGNVAALLGISAFLIIIGGTIGALLTSYTLKDVRSIPKLLIESMNIPSQKEEDMISLFVNLSEKARREGLLALESDLDSELTEDKWDPILNKGIRLVVDGTDPDSIKSILSNEISNYEFRKKHEASIFQAAGGFSPTMGIIGTVLGVVNVLSRLSDTEHLGESIALAFIATLYGISFANMFWLPVGNKLMLKLKIEKYHKELLIEGILSIQQGENPRILQDRLISFVEENRRKKFLETSGSN